METIRAVVWMAVLICSTLTANARIYRWVDEHGKVQFSDSPPPSGKQTATEYDTQGMVRKVPEKIASAGEIAAREAEKKKQLEQKRKDAELLQSFSRPEEIDLLRDRQINAVNARVQTNKVRQQTVEGNIKRLTDRAAALSKAGKKVPESIAADIGTARAEQAVLLAESRKLDAEIQGIKEKAEADKKRLQELRSITPPR